MSLTLHRFPLSGHAHRAELLLSLLGLDANLVDVDLRKGAHKQPDFLKLNRFGQVPVLEDGNQVIADSNAILVYLAKSTVASSGCRMIRCWPRRSSAGCRSLPVSSPPGRPGRD